eukprot:12089041-Karenia_brevis.AAC.1
MEGHTDPLEVDGVEDTENQVLNTRADAHRPPEDAGTARYSGALPPPWPSAVPPPMDNDRILVVKDPWISMIPSHEKTMELRHIKLNLT